MRKRRDRGVVYCDSIYVSVKLRIKSLVCLHWLHDVTQMYWRIYLARKKLLLMVSQLLWQICITSGSRCKSSLLHSCSTVNIQLSEVWVFHAHISRDIVEQRRHCACAPLSNFSFPLQFWLWGFPTRHNQWIIVLLVWNGGYELRKDVNLDTSFTKFAWGRDSVRETMRVMDYFGSGDNRSAGY